MKKLISIVALLLAALLLLTACAQKPAESEPTAEPAVEPAESEEPADVEPEGPAKADGVFVLGLDDSFPPMGFRDENNDIVGFDIDLAAEVCKRLGYELKCQPIDWSTKELELDSGNIDCIWNGLTITDDRRATMLMTPGYIENAQVIVTAVDSDIAALADLEGKVVAAQSGSSAIEALEGTDIVEKASDFIEGSDYVTLLQDLALGRIDAVAIDVVVAEYYNATGMAELKILDEQLAPEEYGIAFKKGNDALYNEVMGALQSMVDDGKWAEISNTWFGEDTCLMAPSK